MIDDLLLFDIGLLEDTTTFVFGVLAGLPSIGLGLGNNFISGTLSNNKSLRDSGVVALTVRNFASSSAIIASFSATKAGSMPAGFASSSDAAAGRSEITSVREAEAASNLNAQTSDFVVQIVNLGSNALENASTSSTS